MSQDSYESSESSESESSESESRESSPENEVEDAYYRALTGPRMPLIEKPKNSLLVLVMSLILPGLGHYYMGQKQKGITFFTYHLFNQFFLPTLIEIILTVVSIIMYFFFLGWIVTIFQFAFLNIFPYIWIFTYMMQAFEAFALAIRLEEGYPIGTWECRYSIIRKHFPVSPLCFSTGNPIIASKEWKEKVTAINKRKGWDIEFEEITLERD